MRGFMIFGGGQRFRLELLRLFPLLDLFDFVGFLPVDFVLGLGLAG